MENLATMPSGMIKGVCHEPCSSTMQVLEPPTLINRSYILFHNSNENLCYSPDRSRARLELVRELQPCEYSLLGQVDRG
jgi:hypothetical protein